MLRTHPLLPWFVWSVGAIGFFYAFFQRVAPSVMVDELMVEFSVSAAILGNLSAFYFYSYASMQIPVGVMVDRWGPRRLILAAWLICAVGSFLFARAAELPEAYVGRLLIGLGSSFFFVTTLKITSVLFTPQRFAWLGGLTMTVGLIGGVGGQAPLAAAVDWIGWRNTLYAAAMVAVLFAVLSWLVVRDRPEENEAAPASVSGKTSILAGLVGAIRRPQTWLLTGASFGLSASLLGFGALWGVPYLIEAYGVSRPVAAGAVSLMLVGWAMGAPMIGWISDRVKRRKAPTLIASVIALAAFLAVVYMPELPFFAIQVLLFVNGFCSGAMVVWFATVRDVIPIHSAGSALSVLNMGTMLSGAFLQPLVGWILDRNWRGEIVGGVRVYEVADYQAAFLVLILAAGFSILLGLFVRETYCRSVES